jgi:hypothetical protein
MKIKYLFVRVIFAVFKCIEHETGIMGRKGSIACIILVDKSLVFWLHPRY